MKLIFILIMLVVNGCSTLDSSSKLNSLCGISVSEVLLEKIESTENKNNYIFSKLIRLPKTDKKTRDSLECIILAEYNSQMEYSKKKPDHDSAFIYLFTIHMLDTNLVLHYVFIFKANIFIEQVFVPVQNHYQVMTTSYYPLHSIMLNKQVPFPEHQMPVSILGQSLVEMPVGDFLESMSEKTNGKFFKKHK